ncbi:MAG: hypothetical protein U5L11_02150 [Arhodomonas sp.]|nr:hypothetical protein [Arhodomonas sp.]
MRTITDHNGRQWTAFVGRESYGVHMILFMPQTGGGAMQAPLDVDTWLEAEQRLAAMTEAELAEQLASSAWPWGEGFDGGTP